MTNNANPPYRLGGLLARARRSWIEQVRDRMQQAGFPGYRQSDAWVLALLLRRPLAIGQLGEAMGISRQAARQMADGLVERGYATFGTDDADARRTLVVLTRRGKAYGRAIWMAQDALNETVRNRVSEADLAAADVVLRAVFPDDQPRREPLTRRRSSVPRLGLRVQELEHQVILPSAGDLQVFRGHAVLCEPGAQEDALGGGVVQQGLGLDPVESHIVERDTHDVAEGGGGEASVVGPRGDPVADAAGLERPAGDAAERDAADDVAGLVEDHVREARALPVTFERAADLLKLAIEGEPAVVS